LRFSRDKRGYENTFVVHAEKRRGRSRSRILYWFRTPPGVKVGRSALDEDAIRLIEQHNPDVDFDWTRILKGGGDSGDSRKPDQPRRDTRPRGGPHQPQRPQGTQPHPAPPREPPAPAVDVANSPPIGVAEVTPAAAEAIIPSGGAHEAPTPAHARLGAEAVIRLRGRYAEILTRIDERIQDPARQEELKAEAERLNPDSWVTEAEVQTGLEQYETVFESLRAVVGRRRRRRRRRGSTPEGQRPQSDSSTSSSSETAVPMDEDESPDDGDEPGSGEL
jgi:hypothetical protein